jgi:RNA ligase (TIGR02306 family)
MATFEAKVYKLKIEEHPNADALELAVVGDYRSIVRKGQFKTGDLGVYIPEAAVLPEWLIEELGLVGKLAGKDKNRVKAVRLRGVLSQGLVYPVDNIDANICSQTIRLQDGRDHAVIEGENVTDVLGITKWEPPIPVHMAGEVFNAHGMTLKYDIENYKRFPDVLLEGEDVIMTEKLHGTWMCAGYHPDVEHPIVTSKGLSGQGLAFKFIEQNENNLYVKSLAGTANAAGDDVVTRARRSGLFGELEPFYVLGEVFGPVQDLKYGADTPQFRVFDIYVGAPGCGRYVNAEDLQSYCAALGVQMVPIIYAGPFSKQKMEEITTGKETISGQQLHMREGVVIKPMVERYDNELGRVTLKSVSEQYLLRKGNTTEFN